LQELHGKKIKLDITDWNIVCYIIPKHNGVELQNKISGDADTTIRGTLQHLFKVGIAKDKHHAMKQHKITFNGDAHVGIAMQQILAKLDIDCEELLSQAIGDIPANMIGKGVAGIATAGKNFIESLKRNTSEYIHHEAKLSPTRDELNAFYDATATLRNDVERFEAKLKQYTAQEAKTPC
ncbi:MAG: hypothetical protein COB66_08035, partial [Coxiella sp. (in: Bacteria)]